MMDELPTALVRNVSLYLSEAGSRWLRELPELVHGVAEQWSLSVGPPFRDLSFSYVAPATRADGTRCALKLGAPSTEFLSEIEALRYWDGDGAVRLLEAEPSAAALLLERVEPGTRLSDLAAVDDDAATHATAEVVRRLWRDPPEEHGLIDLSAWFRSLFRDQRGSEGSRGDQLPEALLTRAQELASHLLATSQPVVLHGDLHHFNVLRSEARGWIAIDPKGLVGDRHFDVAAFLRNPKPLPRSTLRRRLDILTAELGLDRQRIRDWCFAEAVLNACWSLEDSDGKLAEKLRWAELVLSL